MTLENGHRPDTPDGDNLLRRFLLSQGDQLAAVATAAGGRVHRGKEVMAADTGGPVGYINQAVLLRPVLGIEDPLLDEASAVLPADRPATLLSAWPTPDLTARGWHLAGHPAFVVRNALPVPAVTAPGVQVRIATAPSDLAVAERIVAEGYPVPEVAGTSGVLLSPAILRTGWRVRIGTVDGEPVAAAASWVSRGLSNLCLAATLPAARRRGVWAALVWARVADAPELPAAAFTSDDSRPGFERMGFLPIMRFTLWYRASAGGRRA